MKPLLSPEIHVMMSLVVLQCRAFIVSEIMVNDPVTFPCLCPGNCPVVKWTRFIPSVTLIANSWMCLSEQHYQERFTISGDPRRGDFSLNISSVAYNDAGSYRCSCDGKSLTEVKLVIFVPTVVKAVEGENVTLPCYGDTRKDVKDVKWKKAGLAVLLYTHADRSVTPDEASESRFTMSVEGFLGGDLSLHISSVHLSDAGLYRCLIHDESQDGEPRAVLLKVEGLQPRTTTNSSEVTVLRALLGVVVFGDLIGLIICVVRRRRRRRIKSRTELNPDAH